MTTRDGGALRTGRTTGACAAAAAKAAVMMLTGAEPGSSVDIPLPGGGRMSVPVARVTGKDNAAKVIKDAGDDPDVTNGASVITEVSWCDAGDVLFEAGEGVGIVTKKGLSIPPSEPAINPGPRKMIRDAVREVTSKPVRVVISIPGGEELAKRTFNPRLGIKGGLSILGTTGIVRPYSHSAIVETLKCAMDVCLAGGVTRPVLVAGNIGAKAASALFPINPGDVIEAGNEWGFLLKNLSGHEIEGALIIGHPGKLAKLAMGEWDTHSSRSKSALPFVAAVAGELSIPPMDEPGTVEGFFNGLDFEQKNLLARELSDRIRGSVLELIAPKFWVDVALVNMAGELLGTGDGVLERWRK